MSWLQYFTIPHLLLILCGLIDLRLHLLTNSSMSWRNTEFLLKNKLLSFFIPPSLTVLLLLLPPGSHSHHHAGVQKLLRWVCPWPSASNAAHAEREEEEWIESSAPPLTPTPHTHSPTQSQNNNMLLCAAAYNVKLMWNSAVERNIVM